MWYYLHLFIYELCYMAIGQTTVVLVMNSLPATQGRRHGVDWGGHVHSSSRQDHLWD
jgi:hypothetical protein